MIFRVEITKGEPLRYISHLDYANLLQRAIRRAKLPAAYSEGFNPHMKVSFSSALAVGVTADTEYADIELTKDICQPEFFDKLTAALPDGMQLLKAKKIINEHYKSMNALADTAVYTIKLQDNIDTAAVSDAVEKFNALTSFMFLREKPGKGVKKGQVIKKEVDIKNFLLSDLQYDAVKNIIMAKISVSPNGSIKPVEIIEALKAEYLPDADSNDVLINRQSLLSGGKSFIDLLN